MTSNATLRQLQYDATQAIQFFETRVRQLQVVSIKFERLWLKIVIRQVKWVFPELRLELESLALHEELSYAGLIDELVQSSYEAVASLFDYVVELRSITEHVFDLVYGGDEEAISTSNIEAYYRHFGALKREREAITQKLEEYQTRLENAERHLSTRGQQGSAAFKFIQIINDLEYVHV